MSSALFPRSSLWRSTSLWGSASLSYAWGSAWRYAQVLISRILKRLWSLLGDLWTLSYILLLVLLWLWLFLGSVSRVVAGLMVVAIVGVVGAFLRSCVPHSSVVVPLFGALASDERLPSLFASIVLIVILLLTLMHVCFALDCFVRIHSDRVFCIIHLSVDDHFKLLPCHQFGIYCEWPHIVHDCMAPNRYCKGLFVPRTPDANNHSQPGIVKEHACVILQRS